MDLKNGAKRRRDEAMFVGTKEDDLPQLLKASNSRHSTTKYTSRSLILRWGWAS